MQKELINKIQRFEINHTELSSLLIPENLADLIKLFPFMPDILHLQHPVTGNTLLHLIKDVQQILAEKHLEYAQKIKWIIEYTARNFPTLIERENLTLPSMQGPAQDNQANAALATSLNFARWGLAHSALDNGADYSRSMINLMAGSDSNINYDFYCQHFNWLLIRMISPETLAMTKIGESKWDAVNYGVTTKAYSRVIVLLKAGVDPFTPRENGYSVFDIAINYEIMELLRYLYKRYGFEFMFEKFGSMPIITAITRQSDSMTDLLLSYGYQVSAELRRQVNSGPLLKVFLKYNINCVHFLAYCLEQRLNNMVIMLLKQIPDLNNFRLKVNLGDESSMKYTIPLGHYVALKGSYSIFPGLVDMGYNINTKDSAGYGICEMLQKYFVPNLEIRSSFLYYALQSGLEVSSLTEKQAQNGIEWVVNHLDFNDKKRFLTFLYSYDKGINTMDNHRRNMIMELELNFNKDGLLAQFRQMRSLVLTRFLMTVPNSNRFCENAEALINETILNVKKEENDPQSLVSLCTRQIIESGALEDATELDPVSEMIIERADIVKRKLISLKLR